MEKSSYYRRITDLFPRGIESLPKMSFRRPSVKKYHAIISWVVTLYLFLIFLALLYPIWRLYSYSEEVKQAHRNEEKVMKYWQGVVKEHPNYPDAYFQLAKEEARLRQSERALNHLEKALLLDPDFKEAKGLQSEIIKRKNTIQF